MKKFLATWSLFVLLIFPSAIANAACCDSCDACNTPKCCDPCGAVQCVTIPKKHFWNLKRTGYYSVCPCVTGGAAAVCPTKIGECVSENVPSKMVVIPKRHFWEKDRIQRMPIAGCACGCPCAKDNDCGCDE